MKHLNSIPEAACVTIETFEKLIAMDERRRKELLAEIAALRIRERVIAATQDATWVTARFIEPRLAELRAVESRTAMIREKLSQLLARWSKPTPPPPPPPAPAPAPAPASTHVWVETNHPTMIALAA